MLRRILPIAFLGLLGLVAPASAQDGETFTFEGSGWGHGVGMSQWGAYGQAVADPEKSGEEIAAYYYTGSEPANLSDLAVPNDLLTTLENPIWVNIASEVEILEFTAVGGPLELCLAGDGEGPCPKPEQPQEGERWQLRRIDVGRCGFYHNGELQGTSGECRASINWPEADGVRLRYGPDRRKPCAVSKAECEYRRGALKIRDDPVEVGFHVVVTVGIEDYVRSIAEIFAHWKLPGINEAQAVAARTYGAFKFFASEVEDRPANPDQDPGITSSRKDACWCHLYDNTRDQVYAGWWREDGPDQEAWVAGVETTEDRVVAYFGPSWERYTKGGLIQAFFSASSGGISNSNRYGFFTEWNERPISTSQWPYLLPVEDPWDLDPQLGNPVRSWKKTISASTIARLLGWDEVTDVSLVSAASLTSVARVRFEGVDGGRDVSTTVAGAWLRYGLGLRSSIVTAVDDRPAPPTEVPPDTGEPGDSGGDQEPAGPGSGQQPAIAYDELPPFQDIAGSTHEVGIETVRRAGIAEGCDQYSLKYCPDKTATRFAMAVLLVRAAQLPIPDRPYDVEFEDVPDSFPHAAEIYALAEAGITLGCGDGLFCPSQPLTRGQMATFLARALELEPLESLDGWKFDDVSDDHAHRGAIYAIAAEGITVGCDSNSFCPNDPLSRGAMATFVARAFYWGGSSPPDGNG